MIIGKLYKTKVKMWFNERWVEPDSIFVLVKIKETPQTAWTEYTFLYKTKYCVTEYKNEFNKSLTKLFTECV